jgi:hypothetical protein
MRWSAVVGVLALAGASCGSSAGSAATVPPTAAPTSASSSTEVDTTTTITPTTTAAPGSTIRVELADGCPHSIADLTDTNNTAPQWVANPDSAGLDTSFVPGTPTAAVICRYAAHYIATVSTDVRQFVGGDLFTATILDASAAAALAKSANDIVPSNITSACLFGQQSTRYTLIVFAIPGRSDVDMWLKDWIGCPELSNGVRTSGELINGVGRGFLAQLDADAAPAPVPPNL